MSYTLLQCTIFWSLLCLHKLILCAWAIAITVSLITDNPESAFVQALTSAITVYKIAEACYSSDLGTYCNTDSTSYQANINTGRRFAQRFLDSRQLVVLRDENSTREELIQAQLQIHNNGAGREVRPTQMLCACKPLNYKLFS